jgi:predicted nucleic acid-binding protein
MIFFDTSVLVAACDENHPHYLPSHLRLLEAKKISAGCGAHTLAELYAVLSRLPGSSRQRPEQAALIITDIAGLLEPVALTADEYVAAIRRAAGSSISGGTIYDALLIACARKAKAKMIYTWNVRHFRAVAPELAERIQEP